MRLKGNGGYLGQEQRFSNRAVEFVFHDKTVDAAQCAREVVHHHMDDLTRSSN